MYAVYSYCCFIKKQQQLKNEIDEIKATQNTCGELITLKEASIL